MSTKAGQLHHDAGFGFAFNPASQITTRVLANDAYEFALTNAVKSYTVNGRNQYTQVGGAAHAWDANGNLTSDGASTFGYDTENRLVSASGAKSGSLAYDPLGRLWEASTASGVTRFVYDGDRLIAEYSSAGTLLRRYVHGAGVDEPLVWYEGAAVSAPARRYLHTDHQGSVVAVSLPSGTLQQIQTYDAYGVTAAANTLRFQFTGQAAIPDLGLLYYKARFYHPALGRFLQTDPIGYEDDVNLYAYVSNDPLNNVDPTGRSCSNNEKTGTTTCTKEVTGSRIPFKVTFPTPKGWPSKIDSSQRNHHEYDKPVSAGKGSAGKADALRQGTVKDPTPGQDKPATEAGVENDATPQAGFRQAAGQLGNNKVISYLRKDGNGNTMVVNVTLPGHSLFPGYVARLVTIENGQAVIHNVGEGTGWLQSFGPLSDRLINNVWIQQSQEIIDAN